jgi:cyclophilin family peptidyl-prolyl cis-trans isomerase
MKQFVMALTVLAAAAVAARADNPVVVMETSMGTIKIELNQDKAPISTKNFLSYVDDKFYDNTIFHRVMGKENTDNNKDFMIQGGGYTPDKKLKATKPPIKNESGNGLSNTRGTIAMARTQDANSATSQFYINVGDNTFLDRGGYAVFGKVIDGMDVVDKIKAVTTGTVAIEQQRRDGTKMMAPTPNVPTENVVIKAVRVEKR